MRTLVLGFDSLDPRVFERLYEQGRMPNLGRLVETNGYSRFQVANPPQSEVSWTSIATGLNPGDHGMFDFVHRDAKTYTPFVSLLPTEQRLGMTSFVRPFHATTIFDMASRMGYPATSLWWPGTFPARADLPINCLPGLGTPDVMGRLGVGCLYSGDPDAPEKLGKTPVLRLDRVGAGRYAQHLIGPSRRKKSANETLSVPLSLQVTDELVARLSLGEDAVELKLGDWSPILTVKFKLNRFMSVHAITRAILTQVRPEVRLYLLPLQLHPLYPLWPYGTPPSFVRRLWQECGPFLTLGWPQDTTGLEDGCISDEQFLALCDSVCQARASVLVRLLDGFSEGVLGSVFDSIDRVQHMFWRSRPDIVEEWYTKLDALLGRVAARFPPSGSGEGRLVILSDHGFDRLDYSVHLNRWLIDQGYLNATAPGGDGEMTSIDWDRSRAYAIGLNSLYVNLRGREGRGIVPPDSKQSLCDEIKGRLATWTGPDGRPIVRAAMSNREAFSGRLAEYGPDMLVGYSVGYRASPETGLGGWGNEAIEVNDKHWGADHCFDAAAVPGVLFANRNLADTTSHSYHEIPAMTVDTEPIPPEDGAPPSMGNEDTELIEERLRSLGYL
jgi:predicted AlkP superfamily phosphohydrolase/phosphomutase